MKHILSFLLAIAAIFSLNAQADSNTCHFGITFEISNNSNWGYGEPIIVTVEPNSPADKAGIMPGDIIMEINGKATYLRDYQTISMWLFNNSSDVAIFTIRNLSSYFKEYELPRQCRSPKAISEADLATSFSQYSVEDTQERVFVMPLKITTNKDVDYSDYHTFGFIKSTDAPAIDGQVNRAIEQALLKRGLTVDNENPDILIQTSYSYKANTKYVASRNMKERATWRYDADNKKMVQIPILSGNNARAGSDGQFVLDLTIKFFDKKYINTEKATQIWDASVTEFITGSYSIEEYVKLHAPLILMQFPYATDRTMAKYIVSFKRYNYTGICYNMDDMKTVTDVDRNSPAYNAGIRPNNVVLRVNNEKFTYSKDELTNGYKRFIVETMKFRDQRSRFTDAGGFPDCMYWSKGSYADVRKAFTNNVYTPTFSYLYNFENYISDNTNRSLVIEVTKNGKKETYTIRPEIRSSVTLRAL